MENSFVVVNARFGYVVGWDGVTSVNTYTLDINKAAVFSSYDEAKCLADYWNGDVVRTLAAAPNELVDSSVNALAADLPKNGFREVWSWVFMRASFVFSLIAVLVFVVYVCLMLIALSWPLCKPLIDWLCGRM